MISISFRQVLVGLAFILFAQVVGAQVLNQGFLSPLVLRQGQTKIIRPLPDGRIYVSGDYDYHGDRKIGDLVRLTSNGLLDTSFNPVLGQSVIVDFDVLPNGNVVVITTDNLMWIYAVTVLKPDGGVLVEFDYEQIMGPSVVEPLPDNRFLVGTRYGEVYVVDAGLRITNVFGCANDEITDVERQGSNFIIAGKFTLVYDRSRNPAQTHERNGLARFNMTGNLDLTFNADAALTSYGAVSRLLVQPDGWIIPLNNYANYSGSARSIRLRPNGTIDANFKFAYPSLAIDEAFYLNGKITVANKGRIVRVHRNGSVDHAFQPISLIPNSVRVSLLPDQSIVVGNYANALYGFARFSPNGQRNNLYYARLMRYGQIYCMDRTDKSIYIGGEFIKVGHHFTKNVARLNPDGTVLKKFIASVTNPVITIDGFSNAKALINTGSRLYRLESDGKLDPSFSYSSIPGLLSIKKFITQSDGKILIGGGYRLYRLNSNGSRDNTFNPDISIDQAYPGAMHFDLDRTTGKIIFSVYYFPDPYGTSTQELRRLNTDASQDMSFTPPPFPDNSYGGILELLALDNQEVLFITSENHFYNGRSYGVLKLNADGSLNEEFLNNFDGDATYGWYEKVNRFGNHMLLSYYYDYDPAWLNDSYLLNGVAGGGEYLSGITTTWLNDFYADNDTELFILGDVSVWNSSTRYQIAKITYNTTAAASVQAYNARDSHSSSLSFYPNPVKDILTVNVSDKSIVNIFDAAGMKRLTAEVSTSANTIDLTGLNAGRYVIEVISGGKSTREHLVKDH